MFTLNQPEDAELHEGLPLVSLSDSYADLKALLHMLFDPVEYLPRSSEVPQLCYQHELSTLSGPLRLSHKYDLAVLHTNLVKALEPQWPMTLQEWTKVSKSMRNMRLSGVSYPLVNLASVILLAEEAGVTSISRAAWYDLYVECGRNNLATKFSTTKLKNFGRGNLENSVDLACFPSGHHVRFNQGSRALQSAALQILGHGLPARFAHVQTECREPLAK